MTERRPLYLVRDRSFRLLGTDREGGWIGRMRSGAPNQPDIVLDEPSVSHRHAEWRWNGSAVELRDPGSRNGTTMDREPLQGNWTPVSLGSAIDFGSTGKPWVLADTPARGTTEGLTDQRSLLGLHFDGAREAAASLACRRLGSLKGKNADVARELAAEYVRDLASGLDESEAGWMARPDLHIRVDGSGVAGHYKKGTVAGWIRSLREGLARVDPTLPPLLETRPPFRGPGRRTFGEVRLRPPPGGFSFAAGLEPDS